MCVKPSGAVILVAGEAYLSRALISIQTAEHDPHPGKSLSKGSIGRLAYQSGYQWQAAALSFPTMYVSAQVLRSDLTEGAAAWGGVDR